MKIEIFIVIAFLLFSSCDRDENLFNQNSNNNLESFLTDETISVNVPSNSWCIVRVGNDTLSITNESKDVVIPKGITPTIEYRSKTRGLELDSIYNIDRLWQVIAFEDTKFGDHDFNDLVIHPRFEIKNNKLSIEIQPVAYGAYKKINLGYKIYNKTGSNIIVEDSMSDVKKTLFLDNTGSSFINTEIYQRHYDGYTYGKEFSMSKPNNSLSNLKIVWYIVVDNNDTIYAVNRVNGGDKDLIDYKGYPYAFVMYGVNNHGYSQKNYGKIVGYDWFRYPKEKVDIDKCYDIKGWIESKNKVLEKFFRDSTLTFDVCDSSIDGKMIYEVSYPFVRYK